MCYMYKMPSCAELDGIGSNMLYQVSGIGRFGCCMWLGTVVMCCL